MISNDNSSVNSNHYDYIGLRAGVKNTQMNFPYHKESVSQHVYYLKPIIFFLKNMLEKINYFPRRGGGGEGGTPFAENSAKIINLIFEPFPKLHLKHK